jgi:polar amino acid transport system substrate-binding protein
MWVGWGLLLLLLKQADAGDSGAHLVVGTMHTPPFAIHSDDGHWSGISIELVEQIADALGIEVEWREYDYDLQGLLSAVEQRHLDAAIAALPMTPTYEETVDFSYAYFRTGLGIAVLRRPSQPLVAVIHGLASWQFWLGLTSLAGLLLMIGTVIWLLERRHNPHHFRPQPLQGIADGIWWAAVTMTTVGYGDKTPTTWAGRLMSLIWMFGSIFFIAFFAAVLASSFTVVRLQQSVDGPEDLSWARVGVVGGTRGEALLAAQGLHPRSYPFVIQACKALLRGEIEAVVHNKVILDYMIKDYGWKDLAVLPHTLLIEDYAILLPTGSELREPINRALLHAIYGPAWKTALQRYITVAE